MTENEAKIEKMIAEDYKAVLHEAKSMGCNNIKALYNIPIKSFEIIVKALEEIAEYRTIGTPEECRAAVEKQTADGCSDCAFEKVEEWEMPCAKCKRNCKDYWRRRASDEKI